MLAWLGSLGIKAVLEWLLSKVLAVIKGMMADRANHDKAEAQAEADTKKAKELKPDATKEQVSEAIDDTLSHF